MIGFTVIGGYLGAGKTTLLNRILSGEHGIRFALIINDFGAINIDADLIESETDSQINLTNGCVCCSITDGLHEALEQFLNAESKPEHIIVEASGVADVGNIAQYGRAPGLRLDGVLVLADAETIVTKATDKYVAGTIKRQLNYADLIILNKTDLLSADELQNRRDWFARHYPNAVLVEASKANVPIELLLGIHREDKTLRPEPYHHEHYQTWSVTPARSLDSNQLTQFADALPGFVLRAKGFVALKDGGYQRLQLVGARCEIDQVLAAEANSLVVIGLEQDFDPDVLDQLAKKYLA